MRNAPIFCSVELLRTWPPRPEPADGEPCDRSGDATRPVRRGQEIGDIDLSQIDPSAARERVTCPRCEKEVLAEHLESHMTAHSSEILPWLFLGGKRNLENDQELTLRTGITHVLNLAPDVNPHQDIIDYVTNYNQERGLPFVYKQLHFGDTAEQDILSELPGALEFIHQAKLSHEQHHVLVNCAQGVSRSASVTIAYLIQYEAMSLRQAYEHVLQRRTIADPRKEFLNQLGTFECQIFGFATPSLTGEEIFAHRTLLNVDDVTLNTHTPAKATSSTPQELSEASTNAMDSDEAASFYCRRLCYAAVASKAPKGKGKGKRPPPPKAKASVAPRDVEVTSRAERSCSVSELKQKMETIGKNNRDPDSSNDSEAIAWRTRRSPTTRNNGPASWTGTSQVGHLP
ncbi:Dual specificity protein phosphatase 7 [Durusdinium trenchii]|uniref:protein-tyrosine-phosphatase n=1 Tax=Durusdinium trenchii TaxID=1381693 RepID=A0ABP0QE23_9DINO